MEKIIWELATPYLRTGIRKDFYLHTQGVVKAIKLILKKEKGDASLLIPAAILHDIGWSKVPKKFQKSDNEKEKIKALKLHLKYGKVLARNVLLKLKYNIDEIRKILKIIDDHKFKNPKGINERIMIDADNLSDAFKKQFMSDMKNYNSGREELYNYRKNNKFYTKIAEKIFKQELDKRIN